jgi:hypothetical protein
MKNDVSEYSYLWDGSSPEWALLYVNINQENEAPRYGIVDTESRDVLIIEDDDAFIQVKRKMIEGGVRIVSIGNGF